ncbi:hypothetical protein [Alienimonas chondri]|uniref:Nucleotidyltransferase n=1 Tax=Alienimonas chondri TaxID=2681879 RepID=A0ABX1VGL2_9PLAN|nr:hypothetical protein [Alienimonas chondri]NNJ26586.1 hypothetical protein [Alienimonas chondri]
MIEAPQFRRLLDTLEDGGVEYIVIGGLAAIAHGSSMLTQDVDVVYRRTADNIARLAAALVPLNPYLRGVPPGLPFRFDEETISKGMNFTLTTDAGALDLLGHMTGGGEFDDLITFTEPLSIQGRTRRTLTLDALIKAKRAAGRTKDLQAVSILEALREEIADEEERLGDGHG